MWPINLAWLVFIGWVIIYANEWEDYSNYLGERAEVSRIWATAEGECSEKGGVVSVYRLSSLIC